MCRDELCVKRRNVRTPDWYRLQILTIVSQNPSSLTKISSILSISKPLACYYVKQLYEAGLISVVKYNRGQRGPRRKCYGITAKGAAILRSWRISSHFKDDEAARGRIRNRVSRILRVLKCMF